MTGHLSGAAPLLADAAARDPNRVAVVDNGHVHRYGTLLARASAYQRYARRCGLSADDIVLFAARPCLDLFSCLLAGIFGAFTVSFLSADVPPQIARLIVDCIDPALVVQDDDAGPFPGRRAVRCVEVVSGDGIPTVDDLPRAHLSLTSGTLGAPTTAMVDSVGLGQFLGWARTELALSPADRWLEAGDPTSDLALTNALLAFSAGASFSLVHGARRLRIADAAVAAAPTVMRIVPAVAEMLAKDARRRPITLPDLRLLAFGGDILPVALPGRLVTALGAYGAEAMNTYGLTECAGFALYNRFDASALTEGDSPESVPLGQPVPGVEVAREATGELVLTSKAVALEVTRHTQPPAVVLAKVKPGARASLRTGDLVASCPEGWRFIGRATREIKMSGARVNLEHLEAALMDVLGRPVCVISLQGTLVAVVESDDPVSVPQLAAAARSTLPARLIPTTVHRVSQLPRNRSGKVDLRQCVQLAGELATSAI